MQMTDCRPIFLLLLCMGKALKKKKKRRTRRRRKKKPKLICEIVILLSTALQRKGGGYVDEIPDNCLRIGPVTTIIQKVIIKAILRKASEFIYFGES